MGIIQSEKFPNIKVEMINSPSEKTWLWVKECTLNTVGKKLKSSTNSVDFEWKKKLLSCEHSPIRELWFGFRLNIPYWVSVHLVRHHVGVNHYVQTQRNDRQTKYDRSLAPQGETVSHIISLNAQALMQLAHKRLCLQASPETREVVKLMCNEVIKQYPEFKELLVPLCVYRNGRCTEMFPCGKFKWSKPNITRVSVNPELTSEEEQEIRKAIKDNDGYCPCAISKTDETLCMCKEFRDMEEGKCHCGLYVKTYVKD